MAMQPSVLPHSILHSCTVTPDKVRMKLPVPSNTPSSAPHEKHGMVRSSVGVGDGVGADVRPSVGDGVGDAAGDVVGTCRWIDVTVGDGEGLGVL